MSALTVKKTFDAGVVSFLSAPSLLILVHFAVVLTVHRRGQASSLARDTRELIGVSGLLLTPLVLVCGLWAIVYSLVRAGAAGRRYGFVALNVLAVGIGLFYAVFILVLMPRINLG